MLKNLGSVQEKRVLMHQIREKTLRSEEGLHSKNEGDRWCGQTWITTGVAFPHWRALREEDTDVTALGQVGI